MTPRAVLWDMDGLLVDTEPLWTIAETEVCASLGATFTAEAKAAMVGHRIDSAVPILLEHLKLQGIAVESVEATTAAVSAALVNRMASLFAGELHFLPGALELLERCRDQAIPCVLVSSSYRALLAAVLDRIPAGSFVGSLGGDEVVNAKPHPEPYLRAAELARCSPAECLVLEDSVAGMQSAVAAGCDAIMIPSVPGVEADPAWNVLASLHEVAL